MIPPYIDCSSQDVTGCDLYMHKDCPETCSYARDIKGLGVIPQTERTGKKDITDKLGERDN